MRAGAAGGNVVLEVDTGVQIPFHFRCPISLELMRDPVTLATGQTYDRASIESWVATGNTTCPVTRAALTDFTLIPNHTLRRLIQDWCVANRSSGVERIPTPKQPADPSLLRSLLLHSASPSLPLDSRLSSLRRLRSLARDSDKNRSAISTPDFREPLLSLVFASSSDDGGGGGGGADGFLLLLLLQEEALALLVMTLPLSESECLSVAAVPERLDFLASTLLSHSSVQVCVNAAALIESVAAGPELRVLVGNADGVFEGLVKILRPPIAAYPRALKVGIKAIFSLCLAKQNRQKAVAAGAAEALVDRLADFERCDVERALATVELLCRVPAGCEALAAHALTVALLVKIILKVSDRATEYAAGALLSLCSTSEKLQQEAVSAGVVTQLLLLVQSDCTDRAKRKAQLLLKLLRSAWPEDSISNSDDFACTDVARL